LTARPHRRPLARALCAAAAALALAGPAAAGVPAEGVCPAVQTQDAAIKREDAVSARTHEGQALGIGDLPALKDLLPPELWKFRDIFFYEGMRLEIGPCHRVYPPGPWYADATQRFAGKAKVDKDGNLHDYTAGLPFPQIDPAQPGAGIQWAWNLEQRDRGAGPMGGFRLLDLPGGHMGTPIFYKGTFYQIPTAHRADLADSHYQVPEGKGRTWVAGGHFDEPFDARDLAWRQLRPLDTEDRYEEPDDTFVYVPTMRKSRRAATAWIDGLYTPRYLASGDTGGGGVPFGSNQYGPTGSIQPTAGLSIAATENVRRGFLGLALRPNAWEWRFVTEREVLAPINSSIPGWPENPDRSYGPSGLSIATDRWDVRTAIVIEGRARKVVDDIGYVRIWIDEQTAQPLYVIYERPNHLLREVGIMVHRYSGDNPHYPPWPDRGPANVFDPVGAFFYEVGGSGWRRESWDVKSLPIAPRQMRELATTEALEHLH